MVIREWPVNVIHIHIITLEICDTFLASFFNMFVHIVPYFCHDKEIFTFYDSLIKCIFKYFTDLRFISVACGTVKHAVSAFDCSVYCFSNLICCKSVGTKCSHSDTWCFITCVEFYFWHICRINKFAHNNTPFSYPIFSTSTCG